MFWEDILSFLLLRSKLLKKLKMHKMKMWKIISVVILGLIAFGILYALRFVFLPGSIFASDLDVYDFLLSPADYEYFTELVDQNKKLGYMAKESADYRKVECHYRGVEYSVKMDLRGDAINHWINKQVSFKIKTEKDVYLDHRRAWAFIVPYDRCFFIPVFLNNMARDLGIPALANKMGIVRFNGVNQGIYYIEEGLNNDFLEANKISNGVIVELSDNWVEDHPPALASEKTPWSLVWNNEGGIVIEGGHVTPFDTHISNLHPLNVEDAQNINYQVRRLFDALKHNRTEEVLSMIDADEMGKYLAWLAVSGGTHDAVGDNLKLF